MINDVPKAFVEKADSDVIRVKIMDKNIEGELKALGSRWMLSNRSTSS